jgi:hypothetical protein
MKEPKAPGVSNFPGSQGDQGQDPDPSKRLREVDIDRINSLYINSKKKKGGASERTQ